MGNCGWGYGIQVVLSLDLLPIGPVSARCKGRWDLDLCADFVFFSLNYPSKSGHRQFLPSPVRPSFGEADQYQPPGGRSFSYPPLRLHKAPEGERQRSAEVVAPTFMRKIPARLYCRLRGRIGSSRLVPLLAGLMTREETTGPEKPNRLCPKGLRPSELVRSA